MDIPKIDIIHNFGDSAGNIKEHGTDMNSAAMNIFNLSLDGRKFQGRIFTHPSSSATPIFFLSGAFQTMDSWKKFVEFFAPHRTVLLADLPGTGSSDVLPKEYSLDFLAESARMVLDHCGVERSHIVGASYGSPIAYRMAQLWPERLFRMVLAGVMKKVPEHKWQRVFNTIRMVDEGRMKEFALETLDGMLCNDPEKTIARKPLVHRLLGTQLEKMGPADRIKYQQNTLRLLHLEPLDLSNPPRVPTLCFTGEHDVFTTPGYCREIAAAIPGSVYTTLKDADHLFHIEQLEHTLNLFHHFFNALPLSGLPGCNAFECFQTPETGRNQELIVA